VATTDTLLRPETCAMLLVDFQAGLGFGVESASRQVLLNNAVACARDDSSGLNVEDRELSLQVYVSSVSDQRE